MHILHAIGKGIAYLVIAYILVRSLFAVVAKVVNLLTDRRKNEQDRDNKM